MPKPLVSHSAQARRARHAGPPPAVGALLRALAERRRRRAVCLRHLSPRP